MWRKEEKRGIMRTSLMVVEVENISDLNFDPGLGERLKLHFSFCLPFGLLMIHFQIS